MDFRPPIDIKNIILSQQLLDFMPPELIREFGAFVEILPGQEGLVHISELAPYRVNKVEDIIKVGDIIPVKVKNVDGQGKISLSLKDAKK